jgi:putative membrane protein
MATGSYRGRIRPWPVFAIALVVAAFSGIAIAGIFFWHPATPTGFYPFFPFLWIWPFFAILFVVFVARWFLWGWGWSLGRRGGYWQHSTAVEILEERYARGEITKGQFDQMKKDLEEERR